MYLSHSLQFFLSDLLYLYVVYINYFFRVGSSHGISYPIRALTLLGSLFVFTPNKVVKQLNLNLEGRCIVRQGMLSSRSTQGSEMWPSSIGTALKKSRNTGWNATNSN